MGSIVEINCNKAAETLTIKDVQQQSGGNVYTISTESKHACDAKDNGDGEASGLSFGSICLIVMLVLVVVYFVGGFLFLRFAKQREGAEAVPQLEFWKELPGLVVDGGRYV